MKYEPQNRTCLNTWKTRMLMMWFDIQLKIYLSSEVYDLNFHLQIRHKYFETRGCKLISLIGEKTIHWEAFAHYKINPDYSGPLIASRIFTK